ncbi:hypothetical protein [Nitrososphaera sp.]|uniref:hypothetical protein n=1 Tax=Nitrososphaera sp. TaxID=1971748 RepID=UPI002ED8C9A6
MTRKKEEAKEEDLPAEKWLAAFRNPSSDKRPEGSTLVRQFYAAGYYEAYDMVLTHAERMNLEVIWFREKHSCGPYMNRNYPGLESRCTYCNKKFGHEPVPCASDGCESEFCSRDCMDEHATLKHRVRT